MTFTISMLDRIARAVRLHPMLALALLSAIALIASAAHQPAVYDLATPGARVDGLYAPERSNGREFRWTEAQTHIRFPGVGRGAYRLTLVLSGSRPAGMPTPVVHVAINGVPLREFQTTRAVEGYTLDVWPENFGADGDAEITLTSETFVPPSDLRTLGAALYGVQLVPVGGIVWPSAWVLLCCVVAAWGAYGFAGGRAAWPAALAVIGAFALAAAFAPVWAAVWSPYAALAVLTVYAGRQMRRHAGWRETCAALAAGLSFVGYAAQCIALLRTSRFTDVTTMFEAAQTLAAGLDPYDYAIVRDNPLYAHSYVYPPAFAQMLGLFLPLGLHGAIVTWAALNMLLYVAVVAGLLRAFDLAWRSPGFYAFLIVAFNFRPAIDTLSGGQLDVLILALSLGALVLARRGALLRSGIVLASAGLTKLHPLALGLFFLPRARWRGLAGMALGAAAIIAVSALLAPPNLYVRYVSEVLPGRGGENTGNPENQSLGGFLYRWNGILWNDAPAPELAAALKWPAYAASGVLAAATLGALAFGVMRKRGASARRDDAQFAAAVMLMLLVLPTSWMHYQTQALLPLAVVLSYALAARSRALLALWLAAVLLMTPANQEIFRGGEYDNWPLILLQSYKLYGALLLWGALVWMQMRGDADA